LYGGYKTARHTSDDDTTEERGIRSLSIQQQNLSTKLIKNAWQLNPTAVVQIYTDDGWHGRMKLNFCNKKSVVLMGDNYDDEASL